MTREKRFEILEQCKELQNLFPDMSIKNCFLALRDNEVITVKELNYLIEWMTI